MCSNNPEPPAIIGEVNPLNEVAVDADSGNCTPDEQEFDMQAHYVQEPEADVTDNSVAAESTMEDERPNDIPSDEDFDSMSLEECLRFWALKTNQPHQSINMILDIIRKKRMETNYRGVLDHYWKLHGMLQQTSRRLEVVNIGITG